MSDSDNTSMNLDAVNVSADAPMSFSGGAGGDNGGGGGGGGGASASDGSGASVSVAASSPPGTVPSITITLQLAPAYNMNLARQEAAALATLTGIALNRAGVPAEFSTFVAAQVGVALSSPEGLDALMSANQGMANAIARSGEAIAGAQFGLTLSDGLAVPTMGYYGPGG